MRIAICGARGTAGSYLYALLRARRVELDLFDIEPSTRCGITPCGWGVPLHDFERLLRPVGLSPGPYILGSLGHAWCDGVKARTDIVTFDKPRLIDDLLDGAEVKACPRDERIDLGEYDRVVDATGVRAYLPPILDMGTPTTQYRIRLKEPKPSGSSEPSEPGGSGLRPTVIFETGLTYRWLIPLGLGEYHVGCLHPFGADNEETRPLKELLEGLLPTPPPPIEVVCSCMGWVRMTGPARALPFVHGKVWGVGESIGAVSPPGGAGNVFAWETAGMLVEHWKHWSRDPPEEAARLYTRDVLDRYHWMEKCAQIAERTLNTGYPRPRDLPALQRMARRLGIFVNSPIKMLRIKGHITRANKQIIPQWWQR